MYTISHTQLFHRNEACQRDIAVWPSRWVYDIHYIMICVCVCVSVCLSLDKGTGKTLMARQIGTMLHAREPKIVNGPGNSLCMYTDAII